MGWITTKSGKRINTDWFDDDTKQKERQIAENKKQANKKNNKAPDKFKDHAQEYIGGGVDIDKVFNKDDLEFIQNNLTRTDKPLYRVEEAEFTANLLDEDELDADNFKFNGSYRSFSDSMDFIKSALDEDSDNFADMENPVIFEITGVKKHFDMKPYEGEYAQHFGSQGESLVGGKFKLVGEDMKKIGGMWVRVIKISQH